jgi:hypothetical protein
MPPRICDLVSGTGLCRSSARGLCPVVAPCPFRRAGAPPPQGKRRAGGWRWHNRRSHTSTAVPWLRASRMALPALETGALPGGGTGRPSCLGVSKGGEAPFGGGVGASVPTKAPAAQVVVVRGSRLERGRGAAAAPNSQQLVRT